MEFPRDPYDGLPPNVIDVEIDGTIAYCALGRAGVGLVDIDITSSQFPMLVDILETSGVTEGITFRVDEQGNKQMLAGDLSAGMRLWGRPGP